MPLPESVLESAAGLVDACSAIQDQVALVNAARQSDDPSLTKGGAVEALHAATTEWLAATAPIEEALLGQLRTDNPEPNEPTDGAEFDVTATADAVERLAGVSFVHIAVAADLAKLVPIDFLTDGEPVSAAGVGSEPDLPLAIATLAGSEPGEAMLGRLVGLSAKQADDEDKQEPELPLIDALRELVERASEASLSVLTGVIPKPSAMFGDIASLMESAFGLTPGDITSVADDIWRSIAGCVRRVLRHAREILDWVTVGAFGTVAPILKSLAHTAAQNRIEEFARDKVVGPVISWALGANHIATVIKQTHLKRVASGTPAPDNKAAAIHTVLKHNKRWVKRPVSFLAAKLHHLEHVTAAGVPAAPIAGCILLAWTILLTGDELDSPGIVFPNFYDPGLLKLA